MNCLYQLSVKTSSVKSVMMTMMSKTVRVMICFMLPAYLSMSALIVHEGSWLRFIIHILKTKTLKLIFPFNKIGNVYHKTRKSHFFRLASSDDSLSRINSWLRYWIVISVFSLPSIILDYLNLGHQFTLMKTCFIVWCLLPPPLSGSELIFYQVRKHKLDFLCVCNSVENFPDFSFVQTLP